MLSRRRFLGYSIAGMFTATIGCRPSGRTPLSDQQTERFLSPPLLTAKDGLEGKKNYLLGYPVNMNTPSEKFFEWRKQLNSKGIGIFAFNNVGNPFLGSPIPFNTHDFEEELILRFAENYGFQLKNTWGFLSHSGTDSNMHGMYMGRTILKAKTGMVPKCYFTKEAHYSIQILRDLLGMEGVYVNTLPDAGMDADDLRDKIAQNADHPVLVVATTGTTFKGGIDRIDPIRKVLKNHAGYLHVDAALFGGYLPYTSGADELMQFRTDAPGEKRFDSIAVSCHKFFGFPSPAGLFITTADNFEEFNEEYSRIHDPEYIGHVPGTITCSRDAVKPAEFWYFSSQEEKKKQSDDAKAILANADYLMDQLLTHFPDRLPVRSNELSNTVYFIKPGNDIVKKYSLATMHLKVNGKREEFAHVVVMPHVNKSILSEFLDDLKDDRKIMHGQVAL